MLRVGGTLICLPVLSAASFAAPEQDLAQIEEINDQTDEIGRLLDDVDKKDLIAFYSVLNGEKRIEDERP